MAINLSQSHWRSVFIDDERQANEALFWQRELLTELEKLPQGDVSTVKKESNEAGLTSDTDIADLVITSVLEDGRKYRLYAIVHVLTTSTGGQFRVNLTDGGTRIQLAGGQAGSAGANGVITVNPRVSLVGDGESHVLRARLDIISAGTYTVVAASDFPCELTLEDVGISTD